jgi:hypothetical protein
MLCRGKGLREAASCLFLEREKNGNRTVKNDVQCESEEWIGLAAQAMENKNGRFEAVLITKPSSGFNLSLLSF